MDEESQAIAIKQPGTGEIYCYSFPIRCANIVRDIIDDDVRNPELSLTVHDGEVIKQEIEG